MLLFICNVTIYMQCYYLYAMLLFIYNVTIYMQCYYLYTMLLFIYNVTILLFYFSVLDSISGASSTTASLTLAVSLLALVLLFLL